MRKDMKRVLIDRPRNGGLKSRERVNTADLLENWDGGPRKTSIKRHIRKHGHEKNLTDHIAPLKRYLAKQVGRPWDDVYSEICRDNQDHMGFHLIDHVTGETHGGGLVETNCRMENGKVLGKDGFELFMTPFYVHPETGLLLKAPEYRRWRMTHYKSPIVTMDGLEYYKHDDIWYRVRTEAPEKDHRKRYWITTPTDVFGNTSAHYHANILCVWKQQANSKECKRLNLLTAS